LQVFAPALPVHLFEQQLLFEVQLEPNRPREGGQIG
jgi:hypothetical protein